MPRIFLTIDDLTDRELRECVELAARCKHQRAFGRTAFSGKTLALVFQKPSVRTRVSFEVAARQLGGSALYLGPDDAQLDTREPVKDVARTLSRYVDCIVARTFSHEQAEQFAQYATVPVINGLSELHHPCQAMADVLTVREHFGGLKGVTLGYIGDGNNVLHSLAQAAGRLGMRVQVATPPGYRPDRSIWAAAAKASAAHGGSLTWSADPRVAARGADVLYTDVWTSMGQERERRARQRAFRGFQITRALVRLAKPGCKVMHCLPAHRGEEIAADVVESSASIVFDQAENRLHAHKALLILLTRKGCA